MRCFRLTVALLVLAMPAVAGDIHRWTDEEGNIHFGDRPPASVDSEAISVKPNVYESPTIVRNELGTPNSNVVLYSAEWCGYCKKARRYFRANNIQFKEYDVEKSQKGKRDYKKLNATGVPDILVGNKRLNGFSEEAFQNAYKSHAPGT